MKELILLLAKKDKGQLADLRCVDNLLVAENGNEIWIRGISTADYSTSSVRLLPAEKSYFADEEGYLYSFGTKTPEKRLPKLAWSSISQYVRVELPIAAMPAKVRSFYEVKLVASEKERATSALLTEFKLFKDYAETAPEVRLKAIKFAVSEKGNGLIVGNPLPPIPGIEYWKDDALLMPAGYDFEFPVVSKLILQKINPLKHILLFQKTGENELIPIDRLVVGSRSAIRLTKGGRNE